MSIIDILGATWLLGIAVWALLGPVILWLVDRHTDRRSLKAWRRDHPD